jgi:signal transduction histidine kinase/CheY-like chemotaxis protein
LLALLPEARAGFAPRAFPVGGLPEGARRFWNAIDSPNGLVAASTAGIVRRGAAGWTVDRLPNGEPVQMVVDSPAGLIAGGTGFCYLSTPSGWRSLGMDDDIRSGASAGGDTVIVGRRTIYWVDRAGNAKSVGALEANARAFAHVVAGRIIVFTSIGEPLLWEGGALRAAGSAFAWGKNCEVENLVETPRGLLATTSKGLLLVTPTTVEPVLKDRWNQWFGELYVATLFSGDSVIVGSYLGGMAGFSASSGAELWRISAEATGGGVFFLRTCPEGYLIGTASGLFVMPDPTRYRFSSLPTGDVFFATNTSQGLKIGLSSGAVNGDGQSLGYSETIFSLLEWNPGHFIEGYLSRVLADRNHIWLGGRSVTGLAQTGRKLAVCQVDNGVSLVKPDGHVDLIPGILSPNSIAACDAGLLVGTPSRACLVGASGAVELRFGFGVTRVHSTGRSAIAVDATGTLYGPTGVVLGKMPFNELVDAADWNGMLCVLARFPDGSYSVGRVTLPGGQWTPFDLPLPKVPARLVVLESGLCVVAPGVMLEVKAADFVPPLSAEIRLLRPSGAVTKGRLSAGEDAVDVLFPEPRLGPWASPAYFLRVGDGSWDEIHPGARVHLPRLAWGRTVVAVKAAQAGRETASTVVVQRERPWWAGWVGIGLGCVVVIGSGYGAVRWRTRQLSRRAKELEKVVEERTSQLREAQKARENFFATLSHEIRNPLNGVVGLCAILEEAPPGAIATRERLFVRQLYGCAEQLRAMVDDVLDFSKIDRGLITLNAEMFELRNAVEGAARAIDPSLEDCLLDLPQLDCWLCGDCGRFRQVVTNLVSNALKYGVPAVARIKVMTENAGETVRVSVAVTNTGATLSAEELTRIFTGSVRGTDAVQRRIPGSGLGLAVSRKIAETMGGSLCAESAGGLTKFSLKLTLPVGVPTPKIELPAPVSGGGSKVLAVEDEAYNRLVLDHMLQQLGYVVDWAADGVSAFEMASADSYDLILMDYMLPDTTGPELTRKILARAKDPKPPVVMVTAHSTNGVMEEARLAGVSGFVSKPVTKRKLEAAILNLGGLVSVRRPTDGPRQVQADYSSLLHLDNGRQLLMGYAETLPGAWAELGDRVSHVQDPAAKAREVHAFRSRILAVHALELAEQLVLLENAMRAAHDDKAGRLFSAIGPMIDDLAAAAKVAALSSAE